MAAQHSRGVHRANMVAIAAVNYFQAALVTDERVSGDYDKVPAAIYMAPEAITGSPLATASELGASVFGGFERGHFGNQAAESSALAGEHPSWETRKDIASSGARVSSQQDTFTQHLDTTPLQKLQKEDNNS